MASVKMPLPAHKVLLGLAPAWEPVLHKGKGRVLLVACQGGNPGGFEEEQPWLSRSYQTKPISQAENSLSRAVQSGSHPFIPGKGD